MTIDTYRFAYWTLLILAGAVAVILYQHSAHTSAIVGLIGNSKGPVPDPAATLSSNPNTYGAFSKASGQWSPLGPTRETSVFPYNPPQTFQ